ncbi:hypothetical protein FQA39_LY00497 [Lamprigera yunnana]|nr:hypothetical protein FQA39_LY00497 [Lamprigera yunnana]
MKIYFIIAIFAIPETAAHIKSSIITKLCSEKHNLRFRKYSDYFKALPGGDDQVMVFSECLFRQLGYLNGDGEILYEEVKKTPWYFSYLDNYSDLVDKCKNEKGNNPAETCYKFANCLLSNTKRMLENEKQQSSQQLKKQLSAVNVCKKENNMTITPIKYINLNREQPNVWFMCYLRELGCVNSSGVILYDEVKKHNYFPLSSPDRYSTLVGQCKNETANTTVEIFVKCILFNVNQTQYEAYEQGRKSLAARYSCSKKTKLAIKYYLQFEKALQAGGNRTKLYVECYLRQMGYLNGEGDILYEKLKKEQQPMIPEGYVSRSVDDCRKEKGNDTIETIYNFFYCFRINIMQTFYQKTAVNEYMRVKKKIIAQ